MNEDELQQILKSYGISEKDSHVLDVVEARAFDRIYWSSSKGILIFYRNFIYLDIQSQTQEDLSIFKTKYVILLAA